MVLGLGVHGDGLPFSLRNLASWHNRDVDGGLSTLLSP